MKIVSVEAYAELIKRHGFNNYLLDLIEALRRDYARWDDFIKMPRPTMEVPGGVLELMPVCDPATFYSFKYVNCHPKNPLTGHQTVYATGQMTDSKNGFPLLFSEMCTMTAMRTAAMAALVTDYMARKDAHVMAIIGNGAQSEFQVRGLTLVRDIKEVRYHDIDPKAMDKFEKNMADSGLKLVRCKSNEEAVKGADIITVVTACRGHVEVIKDAWVKPGVHINGLGGDCRGKTELEKSIVPRARVIVEYFDQSFFEGEIQQFSKAEAKKLVYAEFHEVVKGEKKGRENDKEITLFDGVGVALEDYAALRLTYELANKYGIGEDHNLTPAMSDPKNLVSVVAEAVADLSKPKVVAKKAAAPKKPAKKREPALV